MAKTIQIEKEEVDGLRAKVEQLTGSLALSEQRATDLQQENYRMKEAAARTESLADTVTLLRKSLAVSQQQATAEAAARARAEKDRFDTLRDRNLRSLLWLRDNIAAAIRTHDSFQFVTRIVPLIVRAHHNRQTEAEVMFDMDANVSRTDDGLMIAFNGELTFDLVLTWQTIDALEGLERFLADLSKRDLLLHPFVFDSPDSLDSKATDEDRQHFVEYLHAVELLRGVVIETVG